MTEKKFSVVIPSYNPDEKLMTVISGLERLGVDDIIIINDGSKEECKSFFDEAKSHSSVTLLTHEINRGKGAALKTAFKYLIESRPDIIGCVTADGDAQHLPSDIIGCASMLSDANNGIILGVRDFSLPNVPPRSKTGNRITSFVFKVFVGMKLSDTQTGLRAIPKEYFKTMCEISGDRYEYETNMLLEIKKNKIPYTERIIETVYIEENRTSHFNPIRDSWKIYKLILSHFFKYIFSSVVSLALEQVIQTLIHFFVKGKLTDILTEISAFMPARIISSVVNYFLNKKYVFSSKTSGKKSFIRYYILWFLQAITTMGLDWLIGAVLIGSDSSFVYTVVTLCVKAVIAIVSYRIQKDWVFSGK